MSYLRRQHLYLRLREGEAMIWPWVSRRTYTACREQLDAANVQNLAIAPLRKTIDEMETRFNRMIGYLTENQRNEMIGLDTNETKYPTHPYRLIHVVALRNEWVAEADMLHGVIELLLLDKPSAKMFLTRLLARIRRGLE